MSVPFAMEVAPDDTPALILNLFNRDFKFDQNAAEVLIGTEEDDAAESLGSTISFVDSDTIFWAASTVGGTLSAAVLHQMSITSNASGIKFVNDEATPFPDGYAYYGAAFGEKGWFEFPKFVCGFVYDEEANTYDVDVEGLAGEPDVTSLIPTDCGLALDTFIVSTVPITYVTDVTLVMEGGDLLLSKTAREITDRYNAAGVLIDRQYGTPYTVNTAVDPCSLSECCDAEELTVEASADPNNGTAPVNTTLDATIGGGVGPYSVTIDWGDGSDPETGDSASILPAEHQYTSGGSRTVTVTVTDACGRTAEDTTGVSVTPAPCDPPTLSSATVGAGGTTLTLVFNEAVVWVGGSVSLSGDQSATATSVSGTGTTTLTFSLTPTTIYLGSEVSIDVAAGAVENGCGTTNGEISGGVTNDSEAEEGGGEEPCDPDEYNVDIPGFGTIELTRSGDDTWDDGFGDVVLTRSGTTWTITIFGEPGTPSGPWDGCGEFTVSHPTYGDVEVEVVEPPPPCLPCTEAISLAGGATAEGVTPPIPVGSNCGVWYEVGDLADGDYHLTVTGSGFGSSILFQPYLYPEGGAGSCEFQNAASNGGHTGVGCSNFTVPADPIFLSNYRYLRIWVRNLGDNAQAGQPYTLTVSSGDCSP